MARIDPVAIKETSEQFDQHLNAMSKGSIAANALLWMKSYVPARSVEEVVRMKIELVASATTNASFAQHYIDEALKTFLYDILERAAEMADADFREAKALLK